MTPLNTAHSYTRIAIIGLCVVLFAVLVLQHCSDRVQLSPLTRHETLRVTIPAPAPVTDTVHGRIDTVWLVRTRTVEDSARIFRILAERDSLACELESAGVGVAFSLDTIIAHTGDTLRVTCDEIRRLIPFSLHYSARDVTIERTHESVQIVETNSSFFEVQSGIGIGGALGVGLNTRGEAHLTLTVGLLFGFFVNEAPAPLPRLPNARLPTGL